MEQAKLKYDKKADVLYIWSEDPSSIKNIITEETGEEILIKKNADTGEIIGTTILHFSKRDDVFEGIDIPEPKKAA